ncbi:MAG: alanine racemase [Candidatus Peribacteria bacterium]|nr:MAG: alanine racemase [Candidatus Peribacteria bacterium]
MSFKKRLKNLFYHNKIRGRSDYTSLNTIEIYADNLVHNFHTLQKLHTTNHAPHTIIPVLKSNAYGHGLREVCQIIQKFIPQDQCPLIAVDSYPEYQIVRDTTDRDILILGEQLPSNYHLYDPRRTHFAVGSLTNIQALIDTDKPRNIHLFLNTGMNREGFQEQDIPQVIQLFTSCPPYEGGRSEATGGFCHNKIKIVGIMSHFANADQINDSYNQTQIDRFKTIYQQIEEGLSLTAYSCQPQYIHINNSAGISKNHDPFFTASRAGLAFYGYNPLESDDPHYPDYHDLRPALRLISTITSIQHLQPGESISYGHKWTTSEPTTIATIPFGYHE